MPDHARSSDAAVQAQLDRLNAIGPGRDVLGLSRIAALCERLGHPERALPPVFHVAGTNGKGSTTAFLRAMLEAEGLSVHAYTSPHLVRFNERIRLAGVLIGDDALAALLAEVLDASEGMASTETGHPSFFEITTAAAFLAFSRNPADACVIEVGLGGRLDATNIVPAPIVTGIASLGIDHEAFLLAPEDGTPHEPLSRIAWEKAGIAKAGVPLVTMGYSPAMAHAIAAQAAAVAAPVIARHAGWDYEERDGALHYRDARGKLTLPRPTLPGAHQLANAALAVAMLRHQSAIGVSDAAMARGIEGARWPARLQRLGQGPLTALAPGRAIWLDGGHNADAGLVLGRHFAEGPPLHLIIGMLANKDAAALLTPLTGRLASITALPIPGHEHHGPDSFPGATAAPDVQAALAALPDDGLPVLIAGSLYLAGEVLAANNELPN